MNGLSERLRPSGFAMTLIVLVVGFSLGVDRFASVSNLTSMGHTAAPLMIVAAGLTFIMIAGRIDISVGSTAFVATTAGAKLMIEWNLNPVFGVMLILSFGAVIGLVNGLLVTRFDLDPLVVTLGMMIALRGVALTVMGGTVVRLPDSLAELSRARIGPVFIDSLLALALLLVGQFILIRTVLGRQLVGIGDNREIANRFGFPVRARTLQAFVACSSLAAFGGLVSASQLGAVNTTFGAGMEFLGIAAVVLGGTSLFGGRGGFLPGAVIGVGILVVIENGLTLLAASPYAYPIVRGLVIFVAMYADAFRSSRQQKRRPKVAPSLQEA